MAFIEQPAARVPAATPGEATPAPAARRPSADAALADVVDVCKHCTHAACLDVCPTGALMRTEFGTVVVQEDICNGCGYCIPACPFGVIDRREADGGAHKCTLCYDRLGDGLTPACAKACPTESIQFGPLDELRERAAARVTQLHEAGEADARLYGDDPDDGVGGDGAFFLLLDEPEVYGLPPDPVVTTRDLPRMWRHAGAAAARRRWHAARPRPGLRGGRGGVAGSPAGARRAADGAAAEFTSYYGRPVLKEPVWEAPDVPGYLFLGGLAGASSVLAACAQLPARRAGQAAKAGAAAAIAFPPSPWSTTSAARALPEHAAGVQADLADERRHLAAGRLRARRRAPPPRAR